MVASKTLAAAIVAFGFSSSALACVNFKGSDASDGSFVVTDGGSMKCSGAIQSGDKDLSCVDGYSLNYDWTDNMSVDGMPVTYCNPSECWSLTIPHSSCDNGWSLVCNFDYSTFGC